METTMTPRSTIGKELARELNKLLQRRSGAWHEMQQQAGAVSVDSQVQEWLVGRLQRELGASLRNALLQARARR
jgi:hypothetical protein